MSLVKGKSRDAISRNVAELVRTYKSRGQIGKTKPKSAAHARKIAVAIAHDTARGS